MMRYAGIATERRVQPAHMKGPDVFVLKLHMLHLRVVRRMQFGSGIVKITRLRAAPAFQHGHLAIRTGANVATHISRSPITAGAEVVHAHGRFEMHIVRHVDQWPIRHRRCIQGAKGIFRSRRSRTLPCQQRSHLDAGG